MTTVRTPRYLRVSLLSACNLQCTYCRPHGLRQPSIVAPADKVRGAVRFLYDSGITKIRFTGGEPTLYRDLADLVSFVKSLDGQVHTALTSNGVLLKSQAQKLSSAGLDSINISLDTLEPTKFRALAGKDCLDQVIAGIDAAVEHVGAVKLNCVLIRGVNDDEAAGLIAFADSRGLDIRFIEFMPNRFSAPGDPRFIAGDDIRRRLPWDLQALPHNPSSAARYYAAPSLKIRIGFISSVSHPFCGACDRIRLTADGRLYTCLYGSHSIDLFELLATDLNRARVEFTRMVKSKQLSGCRVADDSTGHLPSFSSVGG